MEYLDEECVAQRQIRKKPKSSYFYHLRSNITNNHPPTVDSVPNLNSTIVKRVNNTPIRFQEALGRALDQPQKVFESLRDAFLERYSDELRRELPAFHIIKKDVGVAVQERFLQAASQHGGYLHLGYHGTNLNNHPSIYRNGFKLPGGSDVKVVNGNTHGCGVYTSIVGNSWLSRQFCSRCGDLLICAVVEDQKQNEKRDKNKSKEYVSGWFIKRDTRHLREVGHARIVKTPAYVVPIATAQRREPQADQRNLPILTGASPNKNGTPWLGRRRAAVGDTVGWISPIIDDRDTRARRVLRKRAKKSRNLYRYLQRDAKHDLLSNNFLVS